MENRIWFLVISLGVLWGSSFLFVEILLQYLNPITIVFLRVSIASAVLISFIVASKQTYPLSASDLMSLLIMGFFNNVIPFTFITIGQQTTTGGLASILNANTSILTILLAAIFIPSEKLTLNRIIGVFIGLIGVMIAIGYQNIFQFLENSIGKYFILLATVSYAFASIWAKLKLTHLPSLIAAAGMLTMSSLILSPFVIIYHSNELLNINVTILLWSVLFAVLCSVIAYFLYFKILESTGAGNLLICTIIIPPSAIILDAFVLGQVILLTEFIGMIVIILGLIILDGRILNLKNKA